MTTIRDPSAAPPVEGEFRKLDKGVTRRRLVVLLGATALVLTAANLTAAVYLLRATSELRAIDTRLQDLAGLEKRLKGSLDVVNTGIQSQLGILDRDMHDKMTELEDAVGGLQRQLEGPPVAAAAQPEPLPEPEITTTSATPPEPADDAVAAEAADDVPVADIQPPKRRKPSPPPVSRVGSSYQRIESADGKVYYRRVH